MTIQQTKYSYDVVSPHAEYCPWNLDQAFIASMSHTHGHTLVDVYRLFELWKLTEQSSKLSKGDILEIGTYKGGSGAIIAKQASLSCPADTNVYLCDTFTGIIKVGDRDGAACENGQHKASITDVLTVVNSMSLTNVNILSGIFPEDTGHAIEDKKFRLCHIDVDIYQSAVDVLDWVWPRMVKHGIVVYDDYGFRHCDGITYLVEEQMKMSDRLVMTNLNGHAVVIKLDE